MIYSIGQVLDIQVNGKPSQATIFGYEYGQIEKAEDWIYHIVIAEYAFDIKVSQRQLVQGINILTNGNSVKVVTNEKAKAK